MDYASPGYYRQSAGFVWLKQPDSVTLRLSFGDAEMVVWNADMDAAPKDGTEVLLYYRDYLGEPDMVVSGHWHIDEPFEEERTWEHSCGYGHADMWAALPPPPTKLSPP